MSAESFNEALEQFFRTMRQARVKPASIPGTLSVPQLVLLMPLLEHPCGVGELAASAGVASPTASRTLDALERDGVITRRPSETDRRSVVIELTDTGRTQVEEGRKLARAARVELFARLDPEEQQEAERMLRRLTEIIRSA